MEPRHRHPGTGLLGFIRRREYALVDWLWPRIDDPETATRLLAVVRWAAALAALLKLIPLITAEGFPLDLILTPRNLLAIALYVGIYAVGYRHWQAMAAALVAFVLDSIVLARFTWDYGPFARIGFDYGPIELIVSLYIVRTFIVGVRAARVRRRFERWAELWDESKR